MTRRYLLPVFWFCIILTPLVAFAAEDTSSKAAPEKVKILLVGDSTVTDHAGWGYGFKSLAGKNVEALNHARCGASSKSYRDLGLWEKASKTKADYVLFQFGHNDQPGKGPARETDPKTTYTENMARYVDEAQAAGMKPILVTSLTRRHFSDGKIRTTLTGYADAVRALAKKKNVPLIDLHRLSIDQANAAGEEACIKMGPMLKDGRNDRTHLNTYGSPLIGRIVIGQLTKVVPELAPYFPKK